VQIERQVRDDFPVAEAEVVESRLAHVKLD
jgi:hypothetical protein